MTTSEASTAISQAAPADQVPIRGRDVLTIPVLGSVLGGALVVAVFVVWLLANLSSVPVAQLDAKAARLQSDFFANMAIFVLFYTPILWLAWRATQKMGTTAGARFFRPVPGRTIVFALVAGAAISLSLYGMEGLLTRFAGIHFDAGDIERAITPTNAVQLAAAIAVTSLFGPFVEEFYFRGFLLGWLRQRVGVTLAVVLSAAVFALVHGFMVLQPGATGWISTGETFVCGLVLGGFAVATRSLWPCYALHAAYNTAVALQNMLAPS